MRIRCSVCGLYYKQTMVDCEVWESDKCEKRSGCEGERTGCVGEEDWLCG